MTEESTIATDKVYFQIWWENKINITVFGSHIFTTNSEDKALLLLRAWVREYPNRRVKEFKEIRERTIDLKSLTFLG